MKEEKEEERGRDKATETQMSRFKGIEFRCFSQNTEDGILLALFWIIGVSTKRVLEICSGIGWENNAAMLIVHYGFQG